MSESLGCDIPALSELRVLNYLPATKARNCLVEGTKSWVIYPATNTPTNTLENLVPNVNAEAPFITIPSSYQILIFPMSLSTYEALHTSPFVKKHNAEEIPFIVQIKLHINSTVLELNQGKNNLQTNQCSTPDSFT